MKSIILLLALLCAVPYAQSAETKVECRTDRTWLGVYYRECPRDAVATGADARVVGNFIYMYVECEKREVVCELVEKQQDDGNTEL